MPMSGNPKRPQHKASEMFYIDEHGQRQDAEIHNAILDDGDHEAALAVSNAVRERLGIKPLKSSK
jgi:hypothetical protein